MCDVIKISDNVSITITDNGTTTLVADQSTAFILMSDEVQELGRQHLRHRMKSSECNHEWKVEFDWRSFNYTVYCDLCEMSYDLYDLIGSVTKG